MVIAIGVYLTGFAQAIMSRFSSDALSSEQSIMFRKEFYQIAFDNFRTSPFLGVGTGNALGLKEIVHNLPLQVATETGLIGLILFAVVFLIAFYYLWKLFVLFKRNNQIAYSLLTISLCAALVACLIQSLAASDFETPDTWIQLAITSALWTQCRMRPRNEFYHA
jgi:O-antigen ligase